MKVFTDDTDWVIAADMNDARAVWIDQRGGDLEDFEAEEWSEADPTEEIAIWCNTAGVPCDPEEDGGAQLIAKTMQQWADARGRGFLCSTEF